MPVLPPPRGTVTISASLFFVMATERCFTVLLLPKYKYLPQGFYSLLFLALRVVYTSGHGTHFPCFCCSVQHLFHILCVLCSASGVSPLGASVHRIPVSSASSLSYALCVASVPAVYFMTLTFVRVRFVVYDMLHFHVFFRGLLVFGRMPSLRSSLRKWCVCHLPSC